MSLDRRSFTTLLAGLPLASAAPLAQAQKPRDSVTIGVVLEPLGLDPTTSSAGSIGEISHLNIFEGLTRIAQDGAVLPLLAEAWDHDEEGKAYTFKLRRGVKFSDGKPFTSAAVKFSFERARAPNSTNKARQSFFENIKSITTPDAHTVVLVLDDADGVAPFRLGENTAVILHPDTAANAATRPVGTGPYKLEKWEKGKAVTLVKWDGHRDAAKVKLKRVSFRFIEDPAAQVAALRDGSIDAMPRFGAFQAVKQFQADRRFVVASGHRDPWLTDPWPLCACHQRPRFEPRRLKREGLRAGVA
jgi:peptide/nickel transport system substrate-binding protein